MTSFDEAQAPAWMREAHPPADPKRLRPGGHPPSPLTFPIGTLALLMAAAAAAGMLSSLWPARRAALDVLQALAYE